MLRKNLAIAIVALILTSLSFALAPATGAATAIGNTSRITVSDPDIQRAKTVIVKKKKNHKTKVWVYNSKRHGKRYRYSTGSYDYYYGGYWYAQPWWTVGGPGPGINLCIGC